MTDFTGNGFKPWQIVIPALADGGYLVLASFAGTVGLNGAHQATLQQRGYLFTI